VSDTMKMLREIMNAKDEPAESCVEGKEHDHKAYGHMDGRDSYTWAFKCQHCGDVFKVTKKRTGMNKKLWS
jgi:hypothetical protein